MGEDRTAASDSGYLRVAVVQLAYHPAAAKGSGDPLGDPLYEMNRGGSSLLPAGEDAAPMALQSRWKGLRDRVRQAHTAQLARRVGAIVEACRAANVKLLVLPEYSIPPSLLLALAPLSQGVVLVAGSHLADMTASEEVEVYESLGFHGDLDALHERNVSPILLDGGLIGLVPKLHLSKQELRFVKPGQSWAPVPVPEEFGGRLGVLICLDYLHREDDVTTALQECRLIAAPTLTPAHTIADDFHPMASRDSRRFHRPVLHANDSRGGGSSIYADEGRREDLRRFPLHAGLLEPGEEGVVIADIDIRSAPPGESTPYSSTRPIVPYAAASLVYAGIERDYAAWCTELSAILDDVNRRVTQKVRAARELVQRNPPPLSVPGTARHRRLTLLLQDIAEESSLDRIRQLTREIVLPDNVLPLSAARAALARGAADEIHKWLEASLPGAGPFGPVETTLQSAWIREEQVLAACSVTARKALDETSATVRGGPAPVARERQELRVMAYEQVLVEALNEDALDALSLLKQDHHAEGRERFRALLAKVERVADGAPSTALRQKIAVYRLHIATATLNLQEAEAAREQLLAIEPGDLAPKDRLGLVEALAMLGEVHRAEALLPAERDLDSTALDKYRAAVQMLAISRGELPDEVVGSATVHLGAAFLALSKNDMARAAREALAAIEIEGGALFVAHAVGLLSDALNRTVNDLLPEGAAPIPIEERSRVVKTLEARLPEVRAASLPESLQRFLAWVEPLFRALSQDEEALANAPHPRDVQPRSLAEEGGFPAVSDQVFKLVKERKPAEAIALLPADEHPWRQRMTRVDIWRSGGEPSRALEEVLDLARDVPGKAPIEYAAADLLLRADRWGEALAHAEKAFEEMPGIGQRILLAQCLLAVGRTERAWERLQPLQSSDRVAALRVLAKAADESRRAPEAVAFLRQIVARTPGDVTSRLILAQRLAFLHRHEEAADIAWHTFEAYGEKLDIHATHLCGGLQQFPGADPRTAELRLGRAAQALFEKFPGDPRAEQSRMSLQSMMGKPPEDAPPIQFERLVEAGYAYRGNGIDELVGWKRQRRQLEASIQGLAQSGALPAWALCHQLGVPLPLLLTRMLDHRRDVPIPPWCPPVRRTEQQTHDDVRDATLVLSDLEISLIHSLDRDLGTELWGALRQHVAGGALVVPAAAHQRMIFAAAEAMNADRQKLADLDRWLAQVDHLQWSESHSTESDEAVAARLGVPVVATGVSEPVARISPRELVATLRERGLIEPSQEQAIVRALPEEQGVAEPISELPPRALLGMTLLRTFLATETLRFVTEAFKEGLVLTRIAVATLREERRDLDERVRAAALGDTIHRAIAEAQEAGWLRVLVLEEPSLPPLREGTADAARPLILAPTREALAIHELLEKNQRWHRVTADFFGERIVATPETIRAMVWDPDSFHRISERMRQIEPRTLSLPDLVRAIARDLRVRERALLTLAELGFADALGPEEMLDLARRYGGFDKAEPARVLDRQEWVAWAPAHVGGNMARLWLAQAYADVLVRTYTTDDGKHSLARSEAEKQALIRAALSRMERLAAQTRSDVLDQTLTFVGATTMSRFQWSWKTEGEVVSIDGEGPIAQLWRGIADWVGTGAVRRGAFGRAIRDVWMLMANSYDDPGEVGVATLHQAASWRVQRSSPDRYFLEPEIEPLAIFSTLWPSVGILEKLGVTVAGHPITDADMLNHGALLLDDPQQRWINERYAAFEMPVAETGGVIRVLAPIEALLLRAEPAARASAAGELKALQGPHDGALYSLLEAIEKDAENREHLSAYAKRASNSLFRLVRDDPPYLCLWPGAHRPSEQAEVPDLDTLRVLLSEPEGPLPEDEPLSSWLGERTRSGGWSKRIDHGTLFLQASEIPGVLPGLTVAPRIAHPNQSDVVQDALDRLDHVEDHPIARIAGDILFLRVAAAQKPLVRLPQGEVDLRELLPARFAHLLAAVQAEPKPDTMAACEAPLLRLCRQVVQRLAGYQPLPLRDGLWLTYRLFQWLCAQVESLAPDARLDAYRRLTVLAPPPHDTIDTLDPFGFDRHRFDHRLATVLHALVTMEELARAFIAQPSDGVEFTAAPTARREIRSVSSPELEAHLVEIAQGIAHPGPTISVLEWRSLGNVPDLALFALLLLNPSAFGRLSSEARTRRWEALPNEVKPDSIETVFAWRMLSAVADQAQVLTAAERTLLEARLRAIPDSKTTGLWRWIVWVGLFAAGVAHLESEARTLTGEHIREPLAPLVAGRLLVALTARAPDRLAAEANTLRAAAEQAGANVVDVTLTAVVRVALHGTPEAKHAAFALLRRLALEAPFADNTGMRSVIGFFHLGEPAT